MQSVTEQVDATYLEQPPPRPIRLQLVLNVFSDHIFAQPIRAFLSPWVIAGIIALLILFALRASPALRLVPVLVIVVRLALEIRRIWRLAGDDLALLRQGLTIRAHVLRMRSHRSTLGEIDGAVLDCAISIAPRRTYVGSIWLADGEEAARLAHQGRVEVICLPRTPGTWRVIERIASEIRYDRLGATQTIPHEA
jgi:hypothetical protein